MYSTVRVEKTKIFDIARNERGLFLRGRFVNFVRSYSSEVENWDYISCRSHLAKYSFVSFKYNYIQVSFKYNYRSDNPQSFTYTL